MPSVEQIKKAEAEWQLKKDLESIDTSLILTGSRRRGAADAPTPTAPASEEKDKKKEPKAGAESSSEDEMEL